VVTLARADRPLPAALADWLAREAPSTTAVQSADALLQLALRGRPRVVIVDARECGELALEGTRRLKADSYSSIVPTVVVSVASAEAIHAAFAAGADEIVHENMPAWEVEARLDAMLRRSDRDVLVHPSTRLPGAMEIERDIGARLNAGERIAVGYADLDHFKEFNDRYGYHHGDRIIRLLAKILHDIVKGRCGERGFVGHIGGDDFLFVIPLDAVGPVCEDIVDVFDTLIPLQYSDADRRAGYFFGKDRRGQLHRVPLMTLSIGVVTNERRRFSSAAQVSALATEMKSYAKTLPGSVFTQDRRNDEPETPRAG
jgi:diguanylate cyclase (GGDEF)-like protein